MGRDCFSFSFSLSFVLSFGARLPQPPPQKNLPWSLSTRMLCLSSEKPFLVMNRLIEETSLHAPSSGNAEPG